MKNKLLISLSIFLVFLSTPNAKAHAQLVLSNPAANRTTSVMPTLLWLQFDGDLTEIGEKPINFLTVTDSKKKRVDIGGAFVGGARLSTKLMPNIMPGKYSVSYRVVSGDGHPVSGSFTFTFRPKK